MSEWWQVVAVAGVEVGWCRHIGGIGTAAGTADTAGTDASADSTLYKICSKKKKTITKTLPHTNKPSGLWCETQLYKPNHLRCHYADVSVYLATGSTPSGAFVVEADSSGPPLGVGSSARRLGLV